MDSVVITMNKLVYILLVSVFLLDYIHGLGFMPRSATYIPEFLSAIATLILIAVISVKKTLYLSPAYLFIFLFIIILVAIGLVANHVDSSVALSGIRSYFKYFPFFLLPAVYEFSDADVRSYLYLMMGLALIQFPVTLYQRFIESAGLVTGDLVSGTIGTSGKLTVLLMCCITVLTAFYFKKKISLTRLAIMLLLLVIPTMINETKVTIILLPLALLVPTLLAVVKRFNFKQFFSVITLGSVVLVLFISVYDHFVEQRWGYGIIDFFTMEGRVEEYLSKEDDKIQSGKYGRMDALKAPIEILSKEPTSLFLGLGIGNVSQSFLGAEFSGKYFSRYGNTLRGSISILLWELGLLGVFLYITLLFYIFRDVLRLTNSDGIIGDLALGWGGVLFIYAISLFYTDIIRSDALSYVFWLISGILVSHSARISAKDPYVFYRQNPNTFG